MLRRILSNSGCSANLFLPALGVLKFESLGANITSFYPSADFGLHLDHHPCLGKAMP